MECQSGLFRGAQALRERLNKGRASSSNVKVLWCPIVPRFVHVTKFTGKVWEDVGGHEDVKRRGTREREPAKSERRYRCMKNTGQPRAVRGPTETRVFAKLYFGSHSRRTAAPRTKRGAARRGRGTASGGSLVKAFWDHCFLFEWRAPAVLSSRGSILDRQLFGIQTAVRLTTRADQKIRVLFR